MYKSFNICFRAYDFETTQDHLQDDESARHRVNFIGAQVTCSRCIDANRWKGNCFIEEDEICELCGPHRYLTWAQYDLVDKSVSDLHTTSPRPIRDFLNWLLFEGFERKHVSHCYAHNAGKYGLYMSKYNLLNLCINLYSNYRFTIHI